VGGAGEGGRRVGCKKKNHVDVPRGGGGGGYEATASSSRPWLAQDERSARRRKDVVGRKGSHDYKTGGTAGSRRYRSATADDRAGGFRYHCCDRPGRTGLPPVRGDTKRLLFDGPRRDLPPEPAVEDPVEWLTPVDLALPREK